ncbi:hypothetical protein [Aquimarina sediminis]|uniref:hypothetical protein n=1 Tax=Aquimarina sediminis TaxID=2070536 RepID=UPI000CA0686B|nr:hypothetical protein [Aquimarina sediminis]
MANSRKSEAEILEQYRVAFENVKNQPKIATEMAELGYDSDKIEEGEQLLIQTRNTYDFNKREDDETIVASRAFKQEKETLDTKFRKHRKKARAILRKNPEILKKLGMHSGVPNAYTNWIETIRKFYVDIDEDTLQKLASVKITPEDISNGKLQIQKVEKGRAEYLREAGESQDATKQKDAAFAKMDDWMRDFYAIANIALEDEPQLMEALGRKRKS